MSNRLVVGILACTLVYTVGTEMLVRTRKLPAVKHHAAVSCVAYSATMADCGRDGNVRINTHVVKPPLRTGERVGCVFVHEYSPIFRTYLGQNRLSVPCSRS